MMRRAAWLLLPALALAFLLLGSGLDFSYVIPKRLVRLGAIIVAGVCIALSSVIFQTLAGNRVLTPAIMGYEGIYLLFQALLVLWLGTASAALLGAQGNALLSIALMLGYSWLLQRWLLREGHGDVYRLLLLGLVLTMVLGTFTQFIQLKTSPGSSPSCRAWATPASTAPSRPRCCTRACWWRRWHCWWRAARGSSTCWRWGATRPSPWAWTMAAACACRWR